MSIQAESRWCGREDDHEQHRWDGDHSQIFSCPGGPATEPSAEALAKLRDLERDIKAALEADYVVKSGEPVTLQCPKCQRMVPEGVADFGRLREWFCIPTEGGCGTLIRSEKRLCKSRCTMGEHRYECVLPPEHTVAHQTEGQAQMWTNQAQDGGEWSEHDEHGTPKPKPPQSDADRLWGFMWFIYGAMILRTEDNDVPTEQDMTEVVTLFLEAEARGDLE